VRRRSAPSWLAALLIACVAGSVLAQSQPAPIKRAAEPPVGPSWQALSAQQRSALAPLQNDWASIDGPRKAKWLELANRYPRMAPDEQRRMHDRMGEWARLSPQDRARARLTFQEAKQLPNQERQERWQAYQALPENQRRALAKQATAPRSSDASDKPPPERAAKRNMVTNPSLSGKGVRPVAPTVVQAAPGATTTLVNRQPTPPAHQQAGMPKIAATPGFVDRNTLLPQRGPQGAGVRGGSAPAPTNKP
jgi:hypothetical protein